MSKSSQWMMQKVEEPVGAAAAAALDASSPLLGTIRKMADPGFKLFGKTISVTSAAAAAGFPDAGADAGALVFGMCATTHWATAPFSSQKNGSAAGNGGNAMAAVEDEQTLDELRSSSGSNNNSSGADDDSNLAVHHHTDVVLDVKLKTTSTSTYGGSGLAGPRSSRAELPPYVDSAGPELREFGRTPALTHETSTELGDSGEDSDDKPLHKEQQPPPPPPPPGKVVACPRCDSLDTKFCYYNNYNANQPRHFCKNCQRYWTAGGSLRNVPVGAGRRKIKHTASSGNLQGCQLLRSSSSTDGGPIIEPVVLYRDSAQIHDLSLSSDHGTSREQSTNPNNFASALNISLPQLTNPNFASALNISLPQPSRNHNHLGLMAAADPSSSSSSPLLSSPGDSTDSCLTVVNMSSPMFPLHPSGPSAQSLNPFAAATHNNNNTMASKAMSGESGMKPSSDSPTGRPPGQMMMKAPSSSVSGVLSSSGEKTTDLLDMGLLGSPSKEDVAGSHSLLSAGPMHTIVRDGAHVFQHQQIPPAAHVYHHHHHQTMTLGDLGGWTSNSTPFSFFSGAWPYGYNVAWNGLPPLPPPPPVPSSAAAATFCTTVTPGNFLGCNPVSPKFASWFPAPPPPGSALWTGAAAPWAPGGIPGIRPHGVVSETNGSFATAISAPAASKVMPAASLVSGTCGVPWAGAAQGWNLKSPPSVTAVPGKRVSPEGGKTESVIWPRLKSMRVTDHKTTDSNHVWNDNRTTVGIKSDPEAVAGTLAKTFHPKRENQTTTTNKQQLYNPHMFVNTMQFQETIT